MTLHVNTFYSSTRNERLLKDIQLEKKQKLLLRKLNKLNVTVSTT